MSTPQEAPALIQYACERCKTRFVLPPSSRQLKFGGKLQAAFAGLGRTFRLHEGLGAGYDMARRQLLAKMDDEAYQSFVQSFRFCHECRQFVCNECWSTSRRSCLTCVAKSMTGAVRPRAPFVPTGPEIPRPVIAAIVPRKGRMRRDMALVALALAIVLVSLEAGYLLVGATSGGTASATPTPIIIVDTAVPSGSSSASAPTSLVATESPSESPSQNASGSASSGPSGTPTVRPSATPTPPTATPTTYVPPVITPGPTAAPTPSPLPTPTISCNLQGSPLTITTADTASCVWTNVWAGGPATENWILDGLASGSSFLGSDLGAGTSHTVSMQAVRGSDYISSGNFTIIVSP